MTTPTAAPPSATRLLQEGAPLTSPVSTRCFTPLASGPVAGLTLRTPGIPMEELQEQQGQPLSAYARTKRGGGIRKTGLQLLRPTQAYVVGEPVTLKVRGWR
jgi:hypothetical protein